MNDIFYKTDFSINQKKKIINDAKKKCYEWRVDELDCSKSWARKQIDMSFKDIMEKFDKNCHFTIIKRLPRFRPTDKEYIEIDFCTMNIGINYYLWIYIDIDYLDYFVKKYKLVQRL